MYIKQLRLHNFKSFEDVEVEFNPKLTVLVGANGNGKTSVIEGAVIALGTMFVKMDGLNGRGIDKAQARLKSFALGSFNDAQPQYPVTVQATAMTGESCISWSRSLNSSGGNTTILDAKRMLEFGTGIQADLRNGNEQRILPLIAYYGTGRLWDYRREKQSNASGSNNRINGYIDCLDGKANVKLLLNWFEKMTIRKYQNQELGLGGVPELDVVCDAMESCYKRITGNDTVKIQYNMGTRELEIAYREDSGEYIRLSINQLSDGYKSTISLVADIAYRMAVLNPQLLKDACRKTDGIVLIDEVDLHLHPAWQQRILGDLTAIFPKVQFIVSTHAPVIINSVKKENLVILDGSEVFYPTGEVYGKDVNTIVSGIMGAAERPEQVKLMFKYFYKTLSAGEFEKAQRILDDLAAEIGNDDGEIAACRVKLRLRMRPRVRG